ncbi:hypothetical protein HZC07_05950 [Candidatus Micrarchaeota archaeon]|nr:hypothetical protein [Candidatus Micrarchaeota archaeon]
MLINSLKRAMNGYTKNMVGFVSSSVNYIVFLVLFTLAMTGLLIGYFMLVSAFNFPLTLDINTDIVAAVVNIAFLLIIFEAYLFFMCGLNGALAKSYEHNMGIGKLSLTEFYYHALRTSPTLYGIKVIRDIIWALFVAPAVGIYIFALSGYLYTDWLVGIYVLAVTFVLHLLFTPAMLSASISNTGIITSLKKGLRTLQTKHIRFIGMYIIFAFSWLMNFLPLIQIVSIFALYPLTYSAMAILVEGGSAPASKSRKGNENENED